jgi:hypothetical protein
VGILQRLYEDVARELQRATTRPTPVGQSPNAQPTVTPAVMPQTPSQTLSGVPRPFPGGAQFARVVLDGSGNGQTSLSPQRVKEHWQVSFAGVAVTFPGAQTSPTNQAKCSVYVGTSLSSATFVGNTATGSSGDTCAINQDLQPGQSVFAVWIGGDAGQTATLTLFGTYSIGAPK